MYITTHCVSMKPRQSTIISGNMEHTLLSGNPTWILYRYLRSYSVCAFRYGTLWLLYIHRGIMWRQGTRNVSCSMTPGIILCTRPANERRRYIVTSSLIDWVHTQNDPWTHKICVSVRRCVDAHRRHTHSDSLSLSTDQTIHWRRCASLTKVA